MCESQELKPRDVDLDIILEKVGRVGRYQIKHFLLIIIPVLVSSTHITNYIFSAPDTQYRCKIPECEKSGSDFQTDWLNFTIPNGNDRCSKYIHISSNITHFQNSDTCLASKFDVSRTTSCKEYIFKENNTLIEELNIPCEFWKRTLIGTLHSIGTLVALPLIGWISDKFGRRSALVFSAVADGILGLAKSFSVNYSMFAILEFLEPTLGSGLYTSSYILAIELLLPSTRVVGGMFVSIFFASGQALLGLIAWLFPYWRTFLQVLYTPAVLVLFYYWIIEESNRWLLSKYRFNDVIKNLNKMAKTNGRILLESDLEDLYFNKQNNDKFIKDSTDKDCNNLERPKNPLAQVIRSKILLFRTIKCSFWWVTTTFCFYGLSINSVALAGNIYANYTYGGLVEIFAHIFGFVSLSYFGRKKTLFAAFFGGGVCLLSFAFIPHGMAWLSLMIYLLGRFCISLVFGGLYLYTSELFPTPLRHSLLATCSMIGRFGSIAAPQTPLLALYFEKLPSFLFAGTCLISAMLVLTTPETLNIRLPETVEEAENIHTLRKSKSNVICDKNMNK